MHSLNQSMMPSVQGIWHFKPSVNNWCDSCMLEKWVVVGFYWLVCVWTRHNCMYVWCGCLHDFLVLSVQLCWERQWLVLRSLYLQGRPWQWRKRRLNAVTTTTRLKSSCTCMGNMTDIFERQLAYMFYVSFDVCMILFFSLSINWSVGCNLC